MHEFSIDCKQFKNEFKSSIIKNLKKEYSKIHDNVNVEYKKISNIYIFFVYANIQTYNSSMEIVQQQMKVGRHTNADALIFSDIPSEKYYEEYDDSKKDYLQELRDEIDSRLLMLQLTNIKLEKDPLQISENYIAFALPLKNSWKKFDIICQRMNYEGMITKEEKLNFTKKTDTFIEKWLKENQ